MHKRVEPTYEVNFIERLENGEIGRWASAYVSGFKEGESRHEQVEKTLGKLGSPVVDGDFKMRRMRTAELHAALRKNGREGSAPDIQEFGGLTAHITHPEGEDLKRVRDERLEMVAEWIVDIEAVQQGQYAGFGAIRSGLGLITRQNADRLEAQIRDRHGPIYNNGQSGSNVVELPKTA
ncbi:MAG TPA: hypothetical protein VFW77_02950 [Candidatus Saccharimonadales bacterium]|nr:hypothetical protein [Candidatus Saccharimonadales bacterium]